MFVFRLFSFALIAAFALVLGKQAMGISGMASTYPLTLVTVVLAGTLYMIATAVAQRREPPVLTGDVSHLVAATGPERLRLFAFVILWVAYPWLLGMLGFIVTTTLAITVSLCMLGQKRILLAFACAAVFSVVFAVLFTTVFYVPVPAGILDDWLTTFIFRLQS
ncbi:tripartite tricarboxylate transporter TctB family protein [Breoghania sp. JC706]|uniref:tripartite tricarboxylate transporter TctB family protein n=1 Tax=Breoghania sp. JC706 TaxID=3117732 RepID=UPI00300997FF